MTDPARVRYLVEHYPQLQGLRLVPLGLVFVGVAAWHDGQLRWLPGSEAGGVTNWFLASLGVAVLASYIVGAYYRRLFGCVQLRPFQTGGPRLLAMAALVGVSLVVQDVFKWPVSLPLVVVGGMLAYIGVAQRRLRQHYLWIAAACVFLANVGSFGVPPRTQQVMFDLLIAGGLIVAGVGDHMVLLKVLHPQDGEGYVDSTV